MGLKRYEFGVDGASPGFGGIIVVLAKDRKTGVRMAEAELVRLNERRRACRYNDVTLRDDGGKGAPFSANGGVVYSYDGEA